MHSNTWKNFERRVAAALGGQRSGPAVGYKPGGGVSDVIHDSYTIECKISKQPSWTVLRQALEQAVTHSRGGRNGRGQARLPGLAIIGKLGQPVLDSVVAMTLEDFLRHFHKGSRNDEDESYDTDIDSGTDHIYVSDSE